MPIIDHATIKRRVRKTKPSLNFIMAKFMRDVRIYKKYTQKRLAEEIGTKQTSIARWESGNSVPTLETLKKIAEVLNIDFTPEKVFSYEKSSENIYHKFANDEHYRQF